jgi:hypothetical protein
MRSLRAASVSVIVGSSVVVAIVVPPKTKTGEPAAPGVGDRYEFSCLVPGAARPVRQLFPARRI